MKVRKAKKKDLEKVLNLWKEEYSKKPYNSIWKKAYLKLKLRKYFLKNYFYVLEKNKEIIGFIIFMEQFLYNYKIGFVIQFVVGSDFQGKGYGKKLMDYAEKIMKKKGLKRIELRANKKSKAYKFYLKNKYFPMREYEYLGKEIVK